MAEGEHMGQVTDDELQALIDRLREAEEMHSGQSLRLGSLDHGLSANLASNAADALTALRDERRVLREALERIAALDYTRAAINCAACEANKIARAALAPPSRREGRMASDRCPKCGAIMEFIGGEPAHESNLFCLPCDLRRDLNAKSQRVWGLERDLAAARNAAIELAHKASQAEVQLAAKTAEVERLKEIITAASRDRNALGKTLLDLHVVWLDQEKDSNRALRQRVEELENTIRKLSEPT